MDFKLFNRNYYCLISGLPDIMLESETSQHNGLGQSFKEELCEQLHPDDYNLAKLLYLHYDNTNLKNLLFDTNNAFISLGNYTQASLSEQIIEPTQLSEYMLSFIKQYKGKTSDLSIENQLQTAYYKHVFATKNSFLKQWFAFDLNLKNILTAVNCRKYNLDIEHQLVSLGKANEVYNLLLKGIPQANELEEYVPFAHEILEIAQSEMDISEREKAIDQIKWKFLDELSLFKYFSIENILVYILKLEMVDRWNMLDNETGKAFFSKLVRELKNGYEFPEEFSLSKTKAVQNN